jgi:hypothetical protein
MVSFAMGFPSSAYSPTRGGAHCPNPQMHHACAGALVIIKATRTAAGHA